MEINKLTKRLLEEGWMPDQIPPEMKPYNQWYGGWEYGFKALQKLCYETPCGLQIKGSETVGTMGYMGIEWMPENNNPVISCPCFDVTNCEQNHPLLRQLLMPTLRHGGIRQCACRPSNRPYNYENSVQRVHDENDAMAKRLFETFKKSRNGRVCHFHCLYNQWEQSWSMCYDPLRCMDCSGFCPALQREIDQRKANVFYDLKVSWTLPGQGLFPPEQKTSITKGIKFLNKVKSITICEAIAKVCKRDIQRREELRRSCDMMFDKSLTVEVVNIRVEWRESRDLMQDLQDIANGIEVSHKADSERFAKEQKKARREKAAQDLKRRLEIKIADETVDEQDKYRIAKMFTPTEIQEIKEAARKGKDQKATPSEQIILW